MTPSKKWQDNIVEFGRKPAKQFKLNELNFRTHPPKQRKVVKASLDDHGWIKPVIQNIQTGNLLDGHDRINHALENDNAIVPFIIVDVPEEDEGEIIAILDPSSAMAGTDRDKLDMVLESIQTENETLDDFFDDLKKEHYLKLPSSFPEYDETIAEEVKYIKCPECGHEIPK